VTAVGGAEVDRRICTLDGRRIGGGVRGADRGVIGGVTIRDVSYRNPPPLLLPIGGWRRTWMSAVVRGRESL